MDYSLLWATHYYGLLSTMDYSPPWATHHHGLLTTMGYSLLWATHHHGLLTTMGSLQESHMLKHCSPVWWCLEVRLWEVVRVRWGFPRGSDGKESTCNVGDQGSIPGSGRCPGEGDGNPLQYSCLEKSMDRGAWWATSRGSQRVRQDEAMRVGPS